MIVAENLLLSVCNLWLCTSYQLNVIVMKLIAFVHDIVLFGVVLGEFKTICACQHE